jgi:hypothetical protein
MSIMSKKLALTAILATTLALAVPGTSAFARGGGGGHGGGGGGHMGGGGGHMGGGFGGGHMGGGFGGGHVGGLGGSRMGGGFGGGRMGLGGQAFGSAGRSVHAGLHGRHGRRFIGRGFGGYDSNPCWDWQYRALGWTCEYPYY